MLEEQVGFYMLKNNTYMKPDNCRGIKNFLGDLIDGERNDKKNDYHPIEK